MQTDSLLDVHCTCMYMYTYSMCVGNMYMYMYLVWCTSTSSYVHVPLLSWFLSAFIVTKLADPLPPLACLVYYRAEQRLFHPVYIKLQSPRTTMSCTVHSKSCFTWGRLVSVPSCPLSWYQSQTVADSPWCDFIPSLSTCIHYTRGCTCRTFLLTSVVCRTLCLNLI